MELYPLGDRVVVRPKVVEEVTLGGIIIPDTAKEEKAEGVVVCVGPGRYDQNGNLLPVRVPIGATVIYAKYGGDDVLLDGEQYKILREIDVLAYYRA